MPRNLCPVCGAEYHSGSINIKEGVALCAGCGQLSRLSDVVDEERPVIEQISQPPRGCSIANAGREILVRASLRSVGGFMGSLFICLFWNGIVSVFVLVALSGLYSNLVGPVPEWFPAPDDGMPLGATLFLCIFLIPFVTIGLGIVGTLFMNLAGRIEVRIGESEASVFTGVGPLGWRRRFDPSRVQSVKLGYTKWETNGSPNEIIVIDADRTVKFGALLREGRRTWLRAILHALMAAKDARTRSQILGMIPPSIR
jgi:hypothetical protein